MSRLSVGIIGLPNAGKSTLFHALTRAAAPAAPYPFTTVAPHEGIAELPDRRLARLAAALQPDRVVPAVIRFVDIAGLVRGASRGEGLGNEFLGHVRVTDALAHVVRFFHDPQVPHVEGAPDPLRDVELVETELALADLQVLAARREKTARTAKGGERRPREELALLTELQEAIASAGGRVAGRLGPGAAALGRDLGLLVLKPSLYVANIAEADLRPAWGLAPHPGRDPLASLRELARVTGREVVPVSAALEAELAELDPEDGEAYRQAEGLPAGGLAAVVEAGRRLLDLVTFYTVKGPELRAWLVPRGTLAPAAAGKVHSDMERGFIRAEVVPWEPLIGAGSFAAAQRRGLVRAEGRDYEVQDGDVILFRFQV